MKKVLFTLLAVMLLAKNVYSTEVSKNFYMLLPAIHCDNGKISTEKVDDKKESTVNNKVEQSVKTGDNTMIGSYAIIMLLAVGAYTATKKVIR